MALFTRRLGLSAARAVIARPFQRGVAAATANVVRPIAAVWPKQPAGGSITRFVHVHAPPQAAPSSYTAFAVADAADVRESIATQHTYTQHSQQCVHVVTSYIVAADSS